jgi:hypothetical protein
MWKTLFYLFLLMVLPHTFKALVSPLLVPIGFVLTVWLLLYLAD